MERLLAEEPNDTQLLFYRQLLSESEPDRVSKQRQMEIQENVLSGIDDPFNRAIGLGEFYRSNNQLAKAAEEFKKVFSLERETDSSEVSLSPATKTQYKVAAGIFLTCPF